MPPKHASSFEQGYAARQDGPRESQKAQLEAERQQQAYKSLFADNLVRQERAHPFRSSVIKRHSSAGRLRCGTANSPPSVPASPPESTHIENAHSLFDFDPAKQEVYWLPEGTILEAVLPIVWTANSQVR